VSSGAAADPFALADEAAAALGDHDVAVVLGSGWGDAATALGEPVAETAMADLPGFPPPTVGGHRGVVRSVRVGDRRVAVMVGRVHLYEGHDPWVVVHAVRTAIRAGCATVILTNAAGSLREEHAIGSPVVISDHINLTSKTPLAGPHFVDLSEAYSKRLRAIAHEVEPGMPEGVYVALGGPQYETPAEIRMLRTMGADLVGMSTALEAIAARHLGAEVLGISLVTNLAAGLGAKLDHGGVLAAGAMAGQRMTDLLRRIIERL
jgi:purine-nucleoside phosphorylase